MDSLPLYEQERIMLEAERAVYREVARQYFNICSDKQITRAWELAADAVHTKYPNLSIRDGLIEVRCG